MIRLGRAVPPPDEDLPDGVLSPHLTVPMDPYRVHLDQGRLILQRHLAQVLDLVRLSNVTRDLGASLEIQGEGEEARPVDVWTLPNLQTATNDKGRGNGRERHQSSGPRKSPNRVHRGERRSPGVEQHSKTNRK